MDPRVADLVSEDDRLDGRRLISRFLYEMRGVALVRAIGGDELAGEERRSPLDCASSCLVGSVEV